MNHYTISIDNQYNLVLIKINNSFKFIEKLFYCKHLIKYFIRYV